jgi:mannonate dehydratase
MAHMEFTLRPRFARTGVVGHDKFNPGGLHDHYAPRLRELGENPVEVANWFGSRDRIGHVHYRNVRLRVPRQDYTEVTPDNGDNNMLAVMKALVAVKYKYMIFPEHAAGWMWTAISRPTMPPPGAYHVAYARAMLQVALAER